MYLLNSTTDRQYYANMKKTSQNLVKTAIHQDSKQVEYPSNIKNTKNYVNNELNCTHNLDFIYFYYIISTW